MHFYFWEMTFDCQEIKTNEWQKREKRQDEWMSWMWWFLSEGASGMRRSILQRAFFCLPVNLRKINDIKRIRWIVKNFLSLFAYLCACGDFPEAGNNKAAVSHYHNFRNLINAVNCEFRKCIRNVWLASVCVSFFLSRVSEKPAENLSNIQFHRSVEECPPQQRQQQQK